MNTIDGRLNITMQVCSDGLAVTFGFNPVFFSGIPDLTPTEFYSIQNTVYRYPRCDLQKIAEFDTFADYYKYRRDTGLFL